MSENSKVNTGRDWGLFFGGLLVVVIGLIVLFWPGLTTVILAQIAGAVLIVAGVIEVISYFRYRKIEGPSGWTLVSAICNVILGIMFLMNPVISAVFITIVVGAFVACYGVMSIASGVSLRNTGMPWGLLIVNGVVAIICGILFLVFPDPAYFGIFLGVFLVMRGITMGFYGITTSRPTTFI